MARVNIKSEQKCGICKYWFDPTYSAIKPVAPQINLWEMDGNVRKMCLQSGMEKAATNSCSKFRCKIEAI